MLGYVMAFSGSHVMKLQALKQALEVGMKEKRSAAYERRQQLYRIENEVGFDCEEDDLLDDEEEAEMTEQSDTDDDGSDNVNMDFIKNNKKRKVCIYLHLYIYVFLYSRLRS